MNWCIMIHVHIQFKYTYNYTGLYHGYSTCIGHKSNYLNKSAYLTMVLIYLIQFEIFCIIDVETWMSLWISRMEHFIQISGLDSWKTCGPVAQNYCQNCMTDIGSPPLFMRKGGFTSLCIQMPLFITSFYEPKVAFESFEMLRNWASQHHHFPMSSRGSGVPGVPGTPARPPKAERFVMWSPGNPVLTTKKSSKVFQKLESLGIFAPQVEEIVDIRILLANSANPTNIGSLWHCIFDTETNGGCAYRRFWAADLRVVIEDTKDHSTWR